MPETSRVFWFKLRMDWLQSVCCQLLSMLQVFCVERVTSGFKRSGNDQAVIPGETIPSGDVEGAMHGCRQDEFHLACCFEQSRAALRFPIVALPVSLALHWLFRKSTWVEMVGRCVNRGAVSATFGRIRPEA